MFYILTRENGIVLHISDTIGYQENGNVLVDNASIAFVATMVTNVFEVDSIPEGVEIERYCYTPENGFYPNPDWVDPEQEDPDYITPDEILEILDGGGE